MRPQIHKTVLLLCFVFFSAKAFATVEWLAVNHITKELYWAETDHPEGFIGWEVIPEGKYQDALELYTAKGYTQTTYPFKLETLLAIVVLVFLISLYLRFKKKKRANA
ncbi:hypothetical protein [Maribacter sp. 2308TA10-17]|uniref:hypothetical protein n=1 Tax=Maribacter sp. 2308TA10-17 TaxID=3386276 RepID=UPI0039BC8CF9